MKKVLLALIVILYTVTSRSQTVNDVLSKGIPVHKTEKIFLQQIGGSIQYNLAASTNFKPLPDSSIFLVNKSGVNIHFQTLNPLRYSYDTSLLIIADPISVAQDKAFETIYSRIQTVAPIPGMAPNNRDSAAARCSSLAKITTAIIFVSKGLEKDQKKGILATFNKLRDLDFINKTDVKSKTEKIETDSLKQYRDHYKEILKKLDEISDELDKFSCGNEDSKISRFKSWLC